MLRRERERERERGKGKTEVKSARFEQKTLSMQ
jgi:hypothetical protein